MTRLSVDSANTVDDVDSGYGFEEIRITDIAEPAATGPSTPSKPVPKTGFLGFIWSLLRLQPSLRERHKQLLRTLWGLRYLQRTIAVLNSKGGSGKTTIATWLSVVIMQTIKLQVLALDANENSGHTAQRLGLIRSDTATLRALMNHRHKFSSLSKLLSAVGFHQASGVGVVASEAASNKRFERKTFEHLAAILKDCVHTLVADCGNGILHPANLGSVRVADVLVFVGRVGSNDSLDDIANTMNHYRNIGFSDKINKSIVVIIGANPKDLPEYANRYDVLPDQVFAVPANAYMAKDRPVDLTKIPLKVRVALLEIAVAIYNAPLSNVQVDVDNNIRAINEEKDLGKVEVRG